MSAVFFSAGEQRVLDAYEVPQLRADFAERVVRRAMAGDEIHTLPTSDAADNMRQRRHRSPWARAGQRIGALAALGLFSVAAAALGILGPVERLPFIGELLAESVSQPSNSAPQAAPRQASLVAVEQIVIQPESLADERSSGLTRNAPVSNAGDAASSPVRDLAAVTGILPRQIYRPRAAAPERTRRPALQRAARMTVDEAGRMPRGDRQDTPQRRVRQPQADIEPPELASVRTRAELAQVTPAPAAIQTPAAVKTPAQIATRTDIRPETLPETLPEIRLEPQHAARRDIRPDIRPPAPPFAADRARLRAQREASRSARARAVQQRRRALRKRRR